MSKLRYITKSRDYGMHPSRSPYVDICIMFSFRTTQSLFMQLLDGNRLLGDGLVSRQVQKNSTWEDMSNNRTTSFLFEACSKFATMISG